MPYSMQSRLSHLGTRMKTLNAETVTIRRGGLENTATASPILMKAEEVIPGVAATRIEKQDWVIDAADYVLGGDATKPQPGDEIVRSTGEVFRATPMVPTEPVFEFTTSTRNRFILHTDRIAE